MATRAELSAAEDGFDHTPLMRAALDGNTERVKELIHEGNVRDVIIKHEGQTIVHFPLTVGVVGALLVPQLAALGAISALLTHCTVEVVRTDQP